ncbi:MAG TPA: hypothetical protein VHB97_02145 [Polyangia bacterium]|nr:hypothetical protein [Polyangia bacterium]
MTRAPLVVATMLLIGCAPDLPTGGFRCSVEDSACPTGQHCSCGLCVKQDHEAACSFDVAVDGAPLTVREHQPFRITVSAKAADGALADRFAATVDLTFTLADGTKWADVRPSTLALDKGVGSAMVTINRETIPPQSPRLTATFFGNSGGSSDVQVVAPTFVKDAAAIGNPGFGWATLNAGSPAVVFDGAKFRMYFTGSEPTIRLKIGLATSSDGQTFTPMDAPIFPTVGASYPPNDVSILSAAPYQTPDGWKLAFYSQLSAQAMPLDISLVSSPDGATNFTPIAGGSPILTRAACGSYCNDLVWFPSVLQQPGSGVDGGTTSEWLMFFSALQCNAPGGCSGYDNVAVSIGRARSTDGTSFVPEPAPVLSGDTGGEVYLTSPWVLRDGSVYKMWYAFTRTLGPTVSPCDPAAMAQIGYATSIDGFYWVRSPSNPVVTVGGDGWDASTPSLFLGSVVPLDGRDPESGLLLFYSGFRAIPIYPNCVPSGIGRAVAARR